MQESSKQPNFQSINSDQKQSQPSFQWKQLINSIPDQQSDSNIKIIQTQHQISFGPIIYNKRQLLKLFDRQQIFSLKTIIQYKLRNNLANSFLMELLTLTSFEAITQFNNHYFAIPSLTQRIQWGVKPIQMVKSLTKIQFQSLRFLSLANQNLTTIEGIHAISAPNLYQLYIVQNHVTNIRPMIKTDFPKMQRFQFHRNQVSSFWPFSRTKSSMNEFWFYSTDPQNLEVIEDNFGQDYGFLFKQKQRTRMVYAEDVSNVNILKGKMFNKVRQNLAIVCQR